jgi:hypothetical protein
VPQPSASASPNSVYVQYAILERPVADPFLNDEIWKSVDSQVVSSESQSLLRDNGIRIGIMNGILPETLHQMLMNESALQRSRTLLVGSPVVVPVSPVVPQCEFNLRSESGGKTTLVKLEQAQLELDIVPQFEGDSALKLQLVPQIQHGRRHWLPLGATPSTFGLMGSRPMERYQSLLSEVILKPNDLLLVGSAYEWGDTLGGKCFINAAENPRQRVLIIRAGRVQRNSPLLEPTTPIPNEQTTKLMSPSTTLAAQASKSRP